MKNIVTSWMALLRNDEILLGLKKQRFGQGLINGIGGKAEPGETTRATAIRETFEEIGVRVVDCEKFATIYFPNILYNGDFANIVMHAYLASSWQGQPTESEEMAPRWFRLDQIPYSQMFADDKYWMPFILTGKKVEGDFHFDEDMRLLKYKLRLFSRDTDLEP